MDEPSRESQAERATTETRAAFVAALREGDAKAAARVYADDARLVAPSTELIEGREAIQAFWQAGLEAGLSEVVLEELELERQDGLAYEIGRYALRLNPPEGGTVVDRGKYVLVHERQADGSWRWAVEMFNPDAPPVRAGGDRRREEAMRKLDFTRKRLLVAAGVGVLALAAIGGAAIAALSGPVKSYTGCLVTSSGTITKVKEGDSPLGTPCSSGSVEVHFSGGDITAISAGTGLEGGGDNGDVTLAVKPSYRLPQGCTSGQIAKWNGAGWVCAADSNSTYTAGTGLDLTGNEFSIEPDYRVKNDPDCSSGQFATGFNSSGNIQCATPASGGVQAYSAHTGFFALGGQDTTVLSKSVPAGTYLLFASVELANQDSVSQGGFSIGLCSIPGYTTGNNVVRAEASQVTGAVSLSLSSAITHTGGAIELKCTEYEANVDVLNATLTAIKVDSLG